MTSKRAGAGRRRKQEPYYDLARVKELAAQPEGHRMQGGAIRTARDDFGWGVDDIKDAIKKLRRKDFCKTSECRRRPGEMVDYYVARGLKGEDVYLHFYVDTEEDLLIIQSCHRIEK